MNESPTEKAGAPAAHVGIVAVVGRTNAGKSTLVNRLLGEKVSIVSPVVQTTRTVIRGVLTEDRGQIVFLDTPGLHKSRSLLGTEMNKRARSSLSGADVVLLLCDGSREPLLEDQGWMQRLVRSEVPFFQPQEDSPYGDYLEGAIDLLCTDAEGRHALVVDYKTGDAGLTPEEVHERHAMQAEFYAGVLLAEGFEQVECAFVCVEREDPNTPGEPLVARYAFGA